MNIHGTECKAPKYSTECKGSTECNGKLVVFR